MAGSEDTQKKSQAAASSASPALAVAISHDHDGEGAPEVVASGRGALAEKILELAFANDVKVREDSDLVELLQALEIGDEIPLEAFAAVSEILTYVYRASGLEVPESVASGFAAAAKEARP